MKYRVWVREGTTIELSAAQHVALKEVVLEAADVSVECNNQGSPTHYNFLEKKCCDETNTEVCSPKVAVFPYELVLCVVPGETS